MWEHVLLCHMCFILNLFIKSELFLSKTSKCSVIKWIQISSIQYLSPNRIQIPPLTSCHLNKLHFFRHWSSGWGETQEKEIETWLFASSQKTENRSQCSWANQDAFPWSQRCGQGGKSKSPQRNDQKTNSICRLAWLSNTCYSTETCRVLLNTVTIWIPDLSEYRIHLNTGIFSVQYSNGWTIWNPVWISNGTT